MNRRHSFAGSAGQLDMGKALFLCRLSELLFQLGNALPGFYGRRAGHSTQQSPLTDRLTFGLVYTVHREVL